MKKRLIILLAFALVLPAQWALAETPQKGGSLTVTCDLTNTGKRSAVEVAQLYVRDLTASVTRPVKELKGFRRVKLDRGQTVKLKFKLSTDDLAFYNNKGELKMEPGKFQLWVGPNAARGLQADFAVR